MSSYRETGKDRWRRVPKDYFKARDRLQSWKTGLSGLALLLSAGWVALGVDWARDPRTATDGNSLRANHGELARVHVAWEQKCDACHVPFEPIDGRPLFSTRSGSSGRKGDAQCASCHSGPDHHAAAIAAEVPACAQCHRDHRGRDASLVRLDDSACLGCHRALGSHTDPSHKPAVTRTYVNEISRFDPQSHPPFRSEHAAYAEGKPPVDRGGVRFNHALHLSPGLVGKPGDVPYTVGQIPVASERGRYGRVATEAVRLDCASCHVLDPVDLPPGSTRKTLSPGKPGAYFPPVTFEGQCRACHVLTFDDRSPTLEAPHGVQPAEVVAFLRQTYAAQLFDADPKLFQEFRPRTALPGKAPADPDARERFNLAVARAETALFDTKANCRECHAYAGGIDHGVVPRRVEPSAIPEVWYTHAAFDHSAHRAVSCRECHPDASTSTANRDVLVPGLDNCVKCHGPGRREGALFSGTVTGGVSSNCTDCHRYHDGDRPGRGIGSIARGAKLDRSIADFLGGSTDRTKGTAGPP